MKDSEIVPYICYEGEGAYPARNRYLIVYRMVREGKAVRLRAHLAHTGLDGKLHPLFDDFKNPSFNKVAFRGGKRKGDRFLIQSAKNVHEVKKTPKALYKHAITFRQGEFVGIIPLPIRWMFTQAILIDEHHAAGTIREGYVLKPPEGTKSTKTFPTFRRPWDKKRCWFPIPCDYPTYLARMSMLTHELDKISKKAGQDIGRLLYCSALVQQMDQYIHARQKVRFWHWYRYAAEKHPTKTSDNAATQRTKSAYYRRVVNRSVVETELIRKTLVAPMVKEVARELNTRGYAYQRKLDERGRLLARILNSSRHEQAFEKRFATELKQGKSIPGNVRMAYSAAYALTSRTAYGAALYRSHIQNLLRLVLKNRRRSKEQLSDEIKKCADVPEWVKTLREGLIDVVYSFGCHDSSKLRTGVRNELLGAMYLLQHHRVAANVKKLETLLTSGTVHKVNVEAAEFIVASKRNRALQSVLDAIIVDQKAASSASKQKKDLIKAIESTKTVTGALVSLGKSGPLQPYLPAGAKIAAAKGPGTLFRPLDWAFGVRKLYQTAGDGDGLEMTIGAVSHLGNSIAVVGQGALLMGNLPLGLALIGYGDAIRLAASVAGPALRWIRNYEAKHFAAFKETVAALQSADTADHFHVIYRNVSTTKVSKTNYFSTQIYPNEAARAAARKEWMTLSSGYMRGDDFIKMYFRKKHWGLVEHWK